MSVIRFFNTSIEDTKRREFAHNGDILVFQGNEELIHFCKFIYEEIKERFHPHKPEEAHSKLSRKEYLALVEETQKWFSNNPFVKDLFNTVLTSLNIELEKTVAPWYPLRIQSPIHGYIDRSTTPVGLHRDTWETNLYSQTNWWMPISTIDSSRTISFFPKYWSTPLTNSSLGWSLDEFRSKRRKVTERGGSFEELIEIYPPAAPVDDINFSDEIRLIVQPGDVICFSAAHLHASTKNTSTLARISTEYRTIHIDDLFHGFRSPNIDGYSESVSLENLKRISDGQGLTELFSDQALQTVRQRYLSKPF